jgi:hypothetical protein
VILTLTLTGMLIYEHYFQHPRRLLHKPSDESAFFRGIFTKNKDSNRSEAV